MGPPVGCCERLCREHDLIGQVLDAVAMLVARMRRGAAMPLPPLSGAIEFFATFVDRCHEAKEEEGLLPVLVEHGPPDSASLAALTVEHDEGRRLVGALRPLSGRPRVDGAGITLLEDYVAFLRRHMASEDAALFACAKALVSPTDEMRLARAFDQIEERAVGPAGRDVVLSLAEAVTEACRAIGGEAGTTLVLVRHVMRTRPGAVAPEGSLAHAAELMASLGTREVPVVDGAVLVGILTRSDLEPHRGHYEWTTVRAAMTNNPLAVDAGVPIATVARLLVARSFNSIPVTEHGRLVGMVGRRDLLRLLAGDEPLPDVP